MAKPKINVKWNDGTPIDAGVYLVAVRHITGFGSYDYLYWDGKQWLDDTIPNVTGWAVATDILNQIDAIWSLKNTAKSTAAKLAKTILSRLIRN